jgi:2-methylisocitrate lyase-like PEP mutase family enzyme
MAPKTQNNTADLFRSLHQPGHPLLLTNVWDAISASAIASLPGTTALATASFAVAAAAGLADDDLDLPTLLRAASAIGRVAATHSLPLTVDLQDGFGARLVDAVREVIKLGAVGINLEDFGRDIGALYSVEEQCERIRRVVRVASELGVPDFVVNARTDALFTGGNVDEAIARGKAYLEAGAFNVFIWGGPKKEGWGRHDVKRAAKALGGRLNVTLIHGREGGLGVGEIAELGVARISVGPALMRWSIEALKGEAGMILNTSGK